MKILNLLILSLFFSLNTKAQAFSIDTSFYLNYNFAGISSDGNVYGMAFEPDGKLLIYGSFDDNYLHSSDFLRVHNDGYLDNTFYYNGGGNAIYKVINIDSSYIVYYGDQISKGFYNGNSIDTAWKNRIMNNTTMCRDYGFPYFYADKRMLIGDDSTCNIPGPISNKTCLHRFFPSGDLDTSFKHSPNRRVFGIVPYFDKLLLYGGGTPHFTQYDTTAVGLICRIDTAGNLDTSFCSAITDGTINFLHPTPDGKILVGGYFITNTYTGICSIVRLNADGRIDDTYNNYNSLENHDTVYNTPGTICSTTDNGYLIGGCFMNYQGYERHNIVKVDSNGYIDTNYFNGVYIDSLVNKHYNDLPFVNYIVKDTCDRYYVMGCFSYYNGQYVKPIFRMNGITASIQEFVKGKNELYLYPNPAKDEVSISVTKPASKATISVYNVLGVLVKEIYGVDIVSNYVLSLRGFTSGVYIIRIISHNGLIGTGKMVKN